MQCALYDDSATAKLRLSTFDTQALGEPAGIGVTFSRARTLGLDQLRPVLNYSKTPLNSCWYQKP